MSEKIIELAYIRNRLTASTFDENDMQLLRTIKKNIMSSSSPFKDLAINAIENCEEDIKKNNLLIGAQEIQLIHNFTFAEPKKWNLKYFYTIELLAYLEQVNDVKRIQKLIYLLAHLQIKFDV